MPRPASADSIDDLLRRALEPVLRRASSRIARTMAALAAARLDAEVRRGLAQARRRRGGARAARARRSELTRWVADRRARRVPKFVIELTSGLDTKKKIVARYGPDAVFELGKTPPKPR